MSKTSYLNPSSESGAWRWWHPAGEVGLFAVRVFSALHRALLQQWKEVHIMSSHAAHTHWWQTFEAVFGIPCLLAIVLHLVLPISFGDGVIAPVRFLTGSALVVGGTLV